MLIYKLQINLNAVENVLKGVLHTKLFVSHHLSYLLYIISDYARDMHLSVEF